jgi:hypothetical protein
MASMSFKEESKTERPIANQTIVNKVAEQNYHNDY